MNSGDTLVILKSDKKTLLASGRVVDMNLDESKVQIHIENSVDIFRFGEKYYFELIENDDGTYEALYLALVPGTNGMVNRLEYPTFVIGGALAEEKEAAYSSSEAQPVLF